MAGTAFPGTPTAQWHAFRFLAEAIDAKDPYTLGHVERVARYALKLFDNLPGPGSAEAREKLLAASLLHDIGKIRVPSAVLLKPGALDAVERQEIELHPAQGVAILGAGELSERIGPAIRAHHEKLDGSGYPDRLRGDAIPPEARIIAVADIFDACTSKRIYRKDQSALSDAKTLGILRDEAARGKLDESFVQAFCRAYEKGEIHLARASAYAHASDPFITSAGGEARTMLQIARDTYRVVLENGAELGLKLAPAMRHRMAVRLATIANLQGDGAAALQALAEVTRIESEASDRSKLEVDAPALQRALALKLLGRKREAFAAATELLEHVDEDWLRATVELLCADICVDRKRYQEAERHQDLAASALQRMRSVLAADGAGSPYGVELRWWNPGRVALLEAQLHVLKLRRARHLGEPSVENYAKAAIDFCNLHGCRRETSIAHAELARSCSARGDFDRATFLFEREIVRATLAGDSLDRLRRTCWLAECLSRKAACLEHGSEAEALVKRAFALLDQCECDGESGPGAASLSRAWQLHMARIIVDWNGGQRGHAADTARALQEALGNNEEVDATAPRLIADFVVAASEGDVERLIAVANRAAESHDAVRETEVLAELTTAVPGESAYSERLRSLVQRWNGTFWLRGHPAYASLFID